MPVPLASAVVDSLNSGDEVVYLVPMLDPEEEPGLNLLLGSTLLRTMSEFLSDLVPRGAFIVSEPCTCIHITHERDVDLQGNTTRESTRNRLAVGRFEQDEFTVDVSSPPDVYRLNLTYPSSITPTKLFRAWLTLQGVEERAPDTFSKAELFQLWGWPADSFMAGLQKRYPESAITPLHRYVVARFKVHKREPKP